MLRSHTVRQYKEKMIGELILENPIISLFTVLIPVVAVTWKLLHALYVKPRDFKISSMQSDISALKDEVMKIEKSSNPTLVQGKTNKNIDNETHNKESLSLSEVSVVPTEIILNSLEHLIESWKEETLTDLQKSHLEDMYIGKNIIWDVKITNVYEMDDGSFSASITSPQSKFYIDSAIANFDKKYKEALLLIKEGDLVTISGVIDRFFLSPIIKDCSLMKK